MGIYYKDVFRWIAGKILTIASRIITVRQRIRQAEVSSHRPINSVGLLAVSKQHPPEAIVEAFDAGQRAFGENYVQEALVKINKLVSLPIQWHFIGKIQRNKAKSIAQHFSWVHTISSIAVAESLNAARPQDMPVLNVCIQLNIDDEDTKSGVTPQEAALLAAHILTLPRLKLRGLMVIPKPEDDMNKQRTTFLRVSECMQQLNQQLNLSLDTLSMGMSHDLEAAIAAGSTMVRVGTAIFGERKSN